MKNVWIAATVLLLLGFLSACEGESARRETECSEDADCPDGQFCSNGACALRLGDADGLWGDMGPGDTPEDQGDGASTDATEDGVEPDGTEDGVEPDATEDAFEDGVEPDAQNDPVEDYGEDVPCEDRTERCDGRDNDCDDWIDEDGACDGQERIRVELSWDAEAADLDLHLINQRGDFGTTEAPNDNDCHWANPEPDWGDEQSYSDNPRHWVDAITASQGPEVITLARPSDEIYRVAVGYYNSNSSAAVPVNATVSVYFDADLVATVSLGPEGLPAEGRVWNAACLNYGAGTVTPLEEVTLLPELPDPRACGAGDCDTLCDCPQGYACDDGTCAEEPSEAWCCDNDGCPLTAACTFTEGGRGLCGGTINFDFDLAGNDLGNPVDVEDMYADAGVLLSTDRANATVATNYYTLNSASRGNSCATIEPSTGGDVYWLGNVRVDFVMAGEDGDYVPAATYAAGMYIGQTWPGGIAVDFYSPDGDLIGTQLTDNNGTDYVALSSETPIGSLTVRPAGGESSDPNFTIDDLGFWSLFVP